MKEIAKNSFWQLFLIYSILVCMLVSGFLWKFSLQMNIFAIILGILGSYVFISLKDEKETKLKNSVHWIIFSLLIILILVLRIIPYSNNSVPLGYDPGIYKYGIEQGLENLDNWILTGGLEPGFLYIMKFLNFFFTSDFLLIYGLIFFSCILGLSVYLLVKEYSDKETGLIALFLFCISIIQFKAYWFMYYKNIIGMSLILLAFLFLKKSEKNEKWIWAFIISGGILGSIHRPSFYIFGISYFVWAFISPYQIKEKWYEKKILERNFLAGICVIAITVLFYLGKFKDAILVVFSPVLQGFVQPGESAGTFINFFTFQFSILPYLLLSIISLFIFIKKKEFNILVIWCVLNLSIVYFQFFFFNRFIIFLDLIFIILASFSIRKILNYTSPIGKVIILLLIISATFQGFSEFIQSKPLINSNELNTIKMLRNTETNAFVMSTSSFYSPWILGYSQRNTIAPGLFDYDNHSKVEWLNFWGTNNETEMKEFMSVYPKPLYLYVGPKQKDNVQQFPSCFNKTYESEGGKIYNYLC